MKMVDINKEFTRIINNYIKAGYIFNPRSMGGSQGEIGKVDLVKGEELIRVWLDKEASKNWYDEKVWNGYTVYLRIGRWNRPASDSVKEGWTVWHSECKTEYEAAYYQVGGYDSDWYVTDYEEAMQYQNTRYARAVNDRKYNKETKIFDNDRAKEIAVNYLKREAGYKRVNANDIVVTKAHKGYYINYHKTNYHVY